MIGYKNEVTVVGKVRKIKTGGSGNTRLELTTKHPTGESVTVHFTRKGDVPEFVSVGQVISVQGYIDQFMYVANENSKKSQQRFMAESITLPQTLLASVLGDGYEGAYNVPLSERAVLAGEIEYCKIEGDWRTYMIKTKVGGATKNIMVTFEKTQNKPHDFIFEKGDHIVCICNIATKINDSNKKEYNNVKIIDAKKLDKGLFE
ncbi:MAG: hypothetical protein J6M07_04685 [Ruminococcus sp.]|nr:hypothetical protein [Ruminococcus sp.]